MNAVIFKVYKKLQVDSIYKMKEKYVGNAPLKKNDEPIYLNEISAYNLEEW